jgi:23S rRNA pseudouridine1911/1915/1917 synthase
VHHDRRGAVDHHHLPARTSPAPSVLTAHTVEAAEAGLRVDVTIARLTGAPRSSIADAVRAGDVRLNGVPVRASAAVATGDRLEFILLQRTPLEAAPQALPLDIVYEDDSLVVVNKPAGMVSHPAHGARDGTLVNAMLAHAGALPGDPLRAGLVHRLDRDTSGLLVMAKTDAALRALGLAMMRRFIEREYLGLVVGIPEQAEGRIEGAIGRDERNRLRFAIRTEGRPAVTHYALRERLRDASELSFRLETGRTHQIRVHMAAFDHPIVNDPIYGRRDPRIDLPGQALHAWRLRFRHPVTREDLSFEAAPPAAYVRARDVLRG